MKETRALIFSPVSLWDVHHADTIELLHYLKKKGKKIFLVVCLGDLYKCAPNPNHLPNKCQTCNKITFYSKLLLVPAGTKIIPLKIRSKEIKIGKMTPQRFYNFKYKNLPVGRLVSSDLAHDLVSYYFQKDWNAKTEEREKRTANSIGLYNFIKSMIIQNNIDEVYAWNGRRPSDGPVLFAAKALKKKNYCFICGGEAGKIFISSATSVQDFDITLSNLKQIRARISQKMVKKGREFVQNYVGGTSKQIGFYSYNGKEEVKLNNNKKNLLFVTSSPQEQMHLDEVYRFFGFHPLEKMFSFVDNPKLTKHYNITIRWHPRKAESKSFDRDIIQNLAKKNPSIKHIYPERRVDTQSLVHQADVVIGSGSTLCLFAVLLGKPVVLFGPWSSFFGKSVYVVNSPQELCRLLQKSIDPKPDKDALALAYYQATFGQQNRHVFFEEKDGKRKIYLKKSFFQKIQIYPSRLSRLFLNMIPSALMEKIIQGSRKNNIENEDNCATRLGF